MNLSFSQKIIHYFIFACVGLFLFYLILVITTYISLGYLDLGIPDAEFAARGFLFFTSIIGIPLFLLFGIALAHVLIHKKIGKFF